MGPYPFQKFITQEADIGEKIRAQHSFQDTSISQQRTSQMIRWPPPGILTRGRRFASTSGLVLVKKLVRGHVTL